MYLSKYTENNTKSTIITPTTGASPAELPILAFLNIKVGKTSVA